MKNLLDTLFDTALWLLLWGMALYAILSFAAYTAAADEVLTPDERIVALTILGEARGEGELGMYAVACVIYERAMTRKLTSAKVCLQPYQFSIWNAGKGKVKKESELYYLWKSETCGMMYARRLARVLCRHGWRGEKSGHALKRSIVGHANHYHAKSVTPYWTFKTVTDKTGKEIKVPIKPVATIKNHVFYRLK
jgi:spore germination cell wall hydrolase CwlJ-like protein